MAKYLVTGPRVVFGTGFVLGLSEKQIQSRKHLLEKNRQGYKVISTVEFKKGEVIDIITKSLTKLTLSMLELVEKSKKTSEEPEASGEDKG